MRKLDILSNDKRGGKYHWYAIDIESRQATGEICCSISVRGAQCPRHKTEKLAKEAGDKWKKIRTC